MKTTKEKLKEMVREVVRNQLKEGGFEPENRFHVIDSLRETGWSDTDILNHLVRMLSNADVLEALGDVIEDWSDWDY